MTTYAYPEPRVGEKFMGWIDAAVAAKKIRADLKQAQLHSEIPPDVKISVRTRKYAGGQAVDVTLTGWNSEAVWYQTEYRREWTPAARRVVDIVDRIRNAYNRDASDPMTDYYEVIYYGTTRWDVEPWSAS